MLAATSIGALWTGVSADMGIHAVLDRLEQAEPVLLFAGNAMTYNDKAHETHPKIYQVVPKLPLVKNLVTFGTSSRSSLWPCYVVSNPPGTKVQTYLNFASTAASDKQLDFASLPPDHPVYILYSSGTTGAPNPIVHAALGILLQHKKEHNLHCDIRPGERLFYFTT
jgi:acetoacetyl-CoA synthetase